MFWITSTSLQKEQPCRQVQQLNWCKFDIVYSLTIPILERTK